MPKAYIVATTTVTDKEAYKSYMEKAGKIVESHGGRFLTRGGATEVLMGEPSFDRVVVIEFDSPEKARAYYEEEVNEGVNKIREDNSVGVMVQVEGHA